jgi:hypothetical protein
MFGDIPDLLKKSGILQSPIWEGERGKEKRGKVKKLFKIRINNQGGVKGKGKKGKGRNIFKLFRLILNDSTPFPLSPFPFTPLKNPFPFPLSPSS